MRKLKQSNVGQRSALSLHMSYASHLSKEQEQGQWCNMRYRIINDNVH